MKGVGGGNTRKKASIIKRGRQTGTKERKIIFIFLSCFHIFQPSLARSYITCDSFVLEEIQTSMKQKMEQVTAR